MNPDTLDVCQFCGARLRPLFLSPTTPLERPAEPGKPATTPAPAPTTPPSSGGADDWLGQLRSGTSSFDSSSEEPAGSSDATEAVDDWLAKLRAQDEFEEPESAPAPPAEAGPAAGAVSAESSDQNDWLGSLRASGSETPSWLSEPIEPEPQKDDVNRLQTSGSADETIISKGKQPAAEPGLPAWLSEAKPAALPDWLQESGRIGDTSVGLQPPAAEVALPDRLFESAAPPAPTTPPGQTAILETDWVDSAVSDAASELPDWLKPPGSADETIVSKGKQPAAKPSTPDWLQPSSAAETPAPAEAPQESSLPNWLDSPVIKKATGPIEAQPPTQPTAATTPSGEKSVVGTTDWLAKFSTEQQQPITAPEAKKTGVTGWLSSLTPDQVAETPPATPPAEKSVVGITDWLASTEDTIPASAELPDWLKGSEPPTQPPAPTTPSGEKPVVGTTDWLAKFSTEQQQPITAPEAKKTGVTGWLSSLTPDQVAETPPATPPAEKSVVGITDWLASTDDTIPASAELPDWLKGSEPPAPPTQPPAPTTPSGEKPVVGTTDWLAKFSADQQQPVTPPEVKKTGVTGWLSSLTPDQVAEMPPTTPPGEKSVVGTTDWLAGDEAVPTTTELPDWLQGAEPSAQPPAPAAPPSHKAVVGTTDWFASTEAADESALARAELPDWLKGSEPSAPPAQAPASATLPGEKSVVGTTDWLAKFSADQQQPVTPPEAKKTGVTGWLSSLTPDQVPETPPTTSPGEKSVVGTTDWFASAESADESAPTPVELPDWLSAPSEPSTPAAPTTTPGEKSVVGTTDWLAKFSTEQQQPITAPEAKKTGVTGWLSSLTPDQVAETPPTTSPGEKSVVGATDWFASTESADESVSSPVELPDWLSAPTEPSSPAIPPPSTPPVTDKRVVGTTDWLKSSIPGETPPAPPAPVKKTGTTGWLSSPAPQPPPAQTTPPPAPAKRTGTTGWLSSLPGEPPTTPSQKSVVGATDWFTSGESAPPGEPTSAFGSFEFDQVTKPDWVIGGEGEAPAAETPDWVKSAPTPGGMPPPTTPASGSAIVGTTDWLKSFESPEKAASISAFDASSLGKDLRKSDVSDLDWLTAIQPPSTPAPPPAPARPPTGPLTTASTRTGTGPLLSTPPTKGGTGPLGATTARRGTGPLAAPPPAESGIQAADLPPWLAALRPTGLDLGATPPPFTETPETATEETPEWVKPLAAETSAISPDETIPGAPAFTTPPFTTTASLAAVPAFTETHGTTEADLAQANLPSWMRNLRPLNAQAMAREVDLDRTENTGPLAGMRGVLPAESVIAIAGTPGAAVMEFMLSDAQERRAELLRTLVQEETAEEAEIQPRKRKPFIYSFDRLLVALALLAAVAIPTLTATYLPEQYATFAGLFPSPSISASAQPLKDKIDGLPTDRPAVALVAFEYEPGYTGELNPGVASVLAQLMKHDVRVAAVSTYPTGPRVAQNVLDEVAAEVGVTDGYGRNYINLGYIPGGVSGLQQFVTDPTNAVTRDFRDGTDPWKGDVLKDFNELGKFDLIIIASASADSVQRWIEQVKRDGQPMAAITSAAAEPLVAPYASGDNPQLTGLVSGLSGAIGYDEATERKSDAAAQTAVRWSSYAFGLYTSAGALVVGAVFSTAALILARRTALPKKARPTAKAGSAASATAAQKPTARRTTAKRKGAAAKSKAAKPRLRQK